MHKSSAAGLVDVDGPIGGRIALFVPRLKVEICDLTSQAILQSVLSQTPLNSAVRHTSVLFPDGIFRLLDMSRPYEVARLARQLRLPSTALIPRADHGKPDELDLQQVR